MREHILRSFVSNPLVHIYQKKVALKIAAKLTSANRPREIYDTDLRFIALSDTQPEKKRLRVNLKCIDDYADRK